MYIPASYAMIIPLMTKSVLVDPWQPKILHMPKVAFGATPVKFYNMRYYYMWQIETKRLAYFLSSAAMMPAT